ncbi:MAG: PDDEXK nuclease domain-containing protein [archaeon]
MKQPPVKSTGYGSLVDSIGVLLEDGRKQAATAVNSILVRTYWEIGKIIIEYEQGGKERAEYGSQLLANLSKDLSLRHGKGFSIRNILDMRRFYLNYPNRQTVSDELSWSHYMLFLRLDDSLERSFYEKQCIRDRWSVRELDRQINSMLFHRIALSKDKKGVLELSKKGRVTEKAGDLIKDPYVLEFLGLEESSKYSESELEQKLIDHLQKFLLELGRGFMFVGRQQRMTLDSEHFFVDLVFYNRILRCFVLIDLKVGKLTHKDLGQMQMYVNYYDRELRSKEENPTVGILLCADKKESVVRYTLPEDNKQIFASKYKLYLPDKDELRQSLNRLLE